MVILGGPSPPVASGEALQGWCQQSTPPSPPLRTKPIHWKNLHKRSPVRLTSLSARPRPPRPPPSSRVPFSIHSLHYSCEVLTTSGPVRCMSGLLVFCLFSRLGSPGGSLLSLCTGGCASSSTFSSFLSSNASGGAHLRFFSLFSSLESSTPTHLSLLQLP